MLAFYSILLGVNYITWYCIPGTPGFDTSHPTTLAPSAQEEHASNYTHTLHHQSNLSQPDCCASASINTEHDQHVENDLQSVNKHVFEL